jgi:hypothetical protein
MTWKCPECDSTNLSVSVTVWADLTQTDDNFETETEGDHEWDSDSTMNCKDCEFSGNAGVFEVEEKPKPKRRKPRAS